MPEPKIKNRLAEVRKQNGWPVSAIAAEVGVSRQAIYAIEAGTYMPNTALSLRLAKVFGVPVEEIFRLEDEAQADWKADLIPSNSAVRPDQPLQLCRIDGRLIAVTPSPEAWYLPPSDALAGSRAAGKIHVRLHENVASFDDRLIIAGCDPATSLLARQLQKAGVQVILLHQNSSSALSLLKQKRVHIAGTHLNDDSAVRSRFSRASIAVISFAAWQEGLITAPGNPKRIRSIEDLGRKGIRFVNRESGAATRQLLDHALARLHLKARQIGGYDREAPGHLAAAREVNAGSADCCMGIEAAARVFGLNFVPLQTARYDFVMHRPHLQLPAVRSLLDAMTQSSFRRTLASSAGYDTAVTGARLL